MAKFRKKCPKCGERRMWRLNPRRKCPYTDELKCPNCGYKTKSNNLGRWVKAGAVL